MPADKSTIPLSRTVRLRASFEKPSAPNHLRRRASIRRCKFDVFLAHNSKDTLLVESIARQLLNRGIKPWFDKWHLPPGRLFQREIAAFLGSIKCIAVFLGKEGLGRYEELEMMAAMTKFIERGAPVIPVLLPGATEIPDFLAQFSAVRFEQAKDTFALANLEWGITGKRKAVR
jgi:hypothetical protein